MQIESKDIAVSEKSLPWAEAVITNIGDIHFGADGCAIDLLKRDIAWGQEHDALYLGLGDYLDIASHKDREKLASVSFRDATVNALDLAAQDMTEELAKILKPTKGRWLGFITGNHHHVFQDGTTCDQKLAEMLGGVCLGNCAYVRAKFTRAGCQGYASLLIWAHHGAGCGQSPTAPILRLEKVASRWDADVYIMGHQHKIGAIPLPYMRLTGNKVKDRPKHLVANGGYLRGYVVGSQRNGRPEGGYVEKMMLPPTSLGATSVMVMPQRNSVSDWLDVKVLT